VTLMPRVPTISDRSLAHAMMDSMVTASSAPTRTSVPVKLTFVLNLLLAQTLMAVLSVPVDQVLLAMGSIAPILTSALKEVTHAALTPSVLTQLAVSAVHVHLVTMVTV
jgi:hypothetical protein